MDATWTAEDAERTTRYTLTNVEPVEIFHSDGRRFQPVAVAIRVHVSVSLDEPEQYGPTWEATVRGPWLLRSGAVGKVEHVERYWQGHRDVPAWLDTLARDCLAIAGLDVPAIVNR